MFHCLRGCLHAVLHASLHADSRHFTPFQNSQISPTCIKEVAREGRKGLDGSPLLTRRCQSSRGGGFGFMSVHMRLTEQIRIRHNMQLNHQHLLEKEAQGGNHERYGIHDARNVRQSFLLGRCVDIGFLFIHRERLSCPL